MKSVRETVASKYAEGVQFEFSFSTPSNSSTHVAVTTNCYGKSLDFAQMLASTLRKMIPVPHISTGEPEIHILGGRRRKGMMSVELSIKSSLNDTEIAETLKKHGFSEGLEYILG